MKISFTLSKELFPAESVKNVTENIRLYAALGMYHAGKLSIGAACELAGMDRYAFLDFCRQEDLILRTQMPEELDNDFQQLVARA